MNAEAAPIKRRRAGAMQPEQRRQSIVDATLRLVEAGARGLTTQDIAREAGIAEGTIFRAFSTKDDLLRACLEHALASDPILVELDRAGSRATERERAIEACEAIRRHMAYVSPMIEALTPLGVNETDPGRRAEFIDMLVAAVAAMLDGQRRVRRLRATVLVHTMVGSAARAALPNPPELAVDEVVNLLLPTSR